MSKAFFCKSCNNLLGDINIDTGIMNCTVCNLQHNLPDNDKTVFVITNRNNNERIFTDLECLNLSKLKSTNKIAKTCDKCGFGVMAFITNKNYDSAFVCLSCENIYRN